MSMGNKPKTYVPVSDRVVRTEPHSSAPLKYKLASIFLAVLMVYLIIASVLCGIAAASQSGGSVVLLSIAVTYGGKSRCTTRT